MHPVTTVCTADTAHPYTFPHLKNEGTNRLPGGTAGLQKYTHSGRTKSRLIMSGTGERELGRSNSFNKDSPTRTAVDANETPPSSPNKTGTRGHHDKMLDHLETKTITQPDRFLATHARASIDQARLILRRETEAERSRKTTPPVIWGGNSSAVPACRREGFRTRTTWTWRHPR